MVEIKNLVKRYGPKLAVNDISFNIKKGEIVGLLGPNGAGKSTTMNIITGYIAATNGTVEVNGFDIMKNSIAAKSQIGYLPEQPPLYLDMTVKGYLKFIYDLKKVRLNKKQHIAEICERVGISDVYERPIKKLSKGYKQRVGIAQALIGYPPLIILDEPTVGLDPRQILSIRNLIKDLAKDHTTIFSSHILYEVQMICDRIIVINSGKVIADKSPEDLVAEGVSGIKSVVAHIEGEIGKVLDILGGISGVKNVEKTKDLGENIHEYIVNYEGTDSSIKKEIFNSLAQNQLCLTKLDTLDTSLEDAFLTLINKNETCDDCEEKEISVNEDFIIDSIDDNEEENSDIQEEIAIISDEPAANGTDDNESQTDSDENV